MAKIIPQTYYRPQSSVQKYVDFIMTAMEANVNIPTDDKCKMSKCLYNVVSKQFGLSYVKDLFLSLGSADERNQLIFELQMIRTLYFPEKHISPFANNGSILAEDLIKKRKLPIDYENDSSAGSTGLAHAGGAGEEVGAKAGAARRASAACFAPAAHAPGRGSCLQKGS
jgi:hypothetical protein